MEPSNGFISSGFMQLKKKMMMVLIDSSIKFESHVKRVQTPFEPSSQKKTLMYSFSFEILQLMPSTTQLSLS